MKNLYPLTLLFCYSVFAQMNFDDVKPIIKARCLSCHSTEIKAAGVDLSGYNEILDYVVPGGANQSDLWIQIAIGNMPLGQEMTDQEKQLIKKWIIEGANPSVEID